jgi:uracil-DNA glycosylase family 4
MFETSICTACELHAGASHRCLPGKGRLDQGSRLLILLDMPTYVEDRANAPMTGEGVRLLQWMMKRMGLPESSYYLEYVVKCYPPNGKLPTRKSDRMVCIERCSSYRLGTLQMGQFSMVVGLGRLACEALLGSHELPKFEGTYWPPTEVATRQLSPVVWLGPNVNAVLMNPSIAQELNRVLWRAAEGAGYTPRLTEVEPFDWSEFIK